VPGSETWLAIDPDGSIAGFMTLGPGMLDHLYVRPDRTGRGIGSRLVGLAKSRRPAGLDLYTFQVNAGARRFYERRGFRVVDLDDGGRNEEGQPDVRYRWLPTDPPSR
jgi:ribosomal protein S18 acetylase RimI-like enzyme